MNNIPQIVNQLRNTSNPQQMMGKILGDNPNYQKAIQMAQGKSTNQLQAMAERICKEKGINLDDFMRSIGMR